ncbi:unnamed protein product, partial [Didymodactylos carnosus]
NLRVRGKRPTSWSEFKEQLKSAFQSTDFQENLHQQLMQLKQKPQELDEYIKTFRGLIGQIEEMTELTQVMLFINGLQTNYGLYVRSKHPKTVEQAIRESQTYDNVVTTSKINTTKYDPFLEKSSIVELNALNSNSNYHRH